MGSRLELQYLLEKLLGSKNVYSNPPGNITMAYPAIKFVLSGVNVEYANNTPYIKNRRYMVTVIGKTPNDSIVEKLLDLPKCSFDRHYTSDGLNHDVLQLYY